MNEILIITRNSIREYIRDKIVYLCLFMAAILIGLSFILGAMSFVEQQRILLHFGLSAIHLSSLGLVSFFGSYTLNREIERQTCLLVLARPISRDQFLIGKFLAVFVLQISMTIVLAFVLALLLWNQIIAVNYIKIITGIVCEMTMLLSVALFASTFLRASIALFFTVGVFLMSNWLEEFSFFMKKIGNNSMILLSDLIEYAVPNLYRCNWRSIVFLEKGVSNENFIWVLGHTAAWTIFLIALACALFRRKDLV